MATPGMLYCRMTARTASRTVASKSGCTAVALERSPKEAAQANRTNATDSLPKVRMELSWCLSANDVRMFTDRHHGSQHRRYRGLRLRPAGKHDRFALAHGDRPPGAHHASSRNQLLAARGSEKVDLELHGQHSCALGHQGERRIAAGAVECGRQHPGVQEPVLLRQARSEGHPNLDFARGDAGEPRAECRNQPLGGEAVSDGLLELRVLRFSHSRPCRQAPARFTSAETPARPAARGGTLPRRRAPRQPASWWSPSRGPHRSQRAARLDGRSTWRPAGERSSWSPARGPRGGRWLRWSASPQGTRSNP